MKAVIIAQLQICEEKKTINMSEKLPRNYTRVDGTLKFTTHDLTAAAQTYGTPLRITIPDILKENYDYLKKVVGDTFEKNNITANKFKCGYAIKANQRSELVQCAADSSAFLEVSSEKDLDIIVALGDKVVDKTIVCHGFKLPDTAYFERILQLLDRGYHLLPIIDSITELRAYLNCNIKLAVGIRLAAKIDVNGELINDRFGVLLEDLKQCLHTILDSGNIKVDMLHMHVPGTMQTVTHQFSHFSDLFTCYELFNSENYTITHLNFGGGLPTRAYTKTVMYENFYTKIINKVKSIHADETQFPVILTESGRYLAEETQCIILKVLDKKNAAVGTDWYILNGSAINLIPEAFLDKDKIFQLLPTYTNSTSTTNCYCAGITCDPEDFFSNVPLNLPNLNQEQELYVVIPNTGAYQESLTSAARGFPGHCMIDNAKDVIAKNDELIPTFISSENFLNYLGYK